MSRLRQTSACALRNAIRGLSIAFLLSATVPAWAGSSVELEVRAGGAVTYGIENDHHGQRMLQGTGIRIGSLKSAAGIMPIMLGRLSFSGGTFSGSNGVWGPGGNLTITGCADLNHTSKCGAGDVSGTLMTGSFLSTKVIQQNGKEVLIAQIEDQVSPELAALLHLPTRTYRGQLELVLADLRFPCLRLQKRVTGGFLNDGLTVPEPSSLILLAASLAGVGVASLFRIARTN